MSQFLALPAEIRNGIYNEVIKRDVIVYLRPNAFATSSNSPLARTCKQVRQEFNSLAHDHPAVQIVTKVNRFDFSHLLAYIKHLWETEDKPFRETEWPARPMKDRRFTIRLHVDGFTAEHRPRANVWLDGLHSFREQGMMLMIRYSIVEERHLRGYDMSTLAFGMELNREHRFYATERKKLQDALEDTYLRRSSSLAIRRMVQG